jgi:hypothetical protein
LLLDDLLVNQSESIGSSTNYVADLSSLKRNFVANLWGIGSYNAVVVQYSLRSEKPDV